MPRLARSERAFRYGVAPAPDDEAAAAAAEVPTASACSTTAEAGPGCAAAARPGGLFAHAGCRRARRPVRRNAAAKASSARTAAAAAEATTMAALGVPPPPWTRGAGPVRDDEASAATVFGGGGAGSSAGPPLSTGGTGVEGSAANPGAGGAVVDGGGVHSMGKSGSCSARLVSPAAEWTRKRSEVSVRSGDIGERESDELLERGREGARVMAVEWERRSAGVGMLAFCRGTLDFTQKTGQFLPRRHFSAGYRWTKRLFAGGCGLLALWLLSLALNATGMLTLSAWLAPLFEAGMALALCGVLSGVVLDYRALRKAGN